MVMAIRKPHENENKGKTDYPHLKSNYNDSNINNVSHQANLPTNFNLKSITLEDCDRGVFEEFHKRFKVGDKFLPVILLDAELASIHMQNYEQYDDEKGFLNGPFFTMYRSKSIPKFRTNPAYKKAVYVVPKSKPNGIVYEEYITEGPLSYDLIYEFKFITTYREYTNQMEEQMRHYFRNKRNVVVVNEERFFISPDSKDTLSEVQIVNQDSIDKRSMYVSSFTLKLDCHTRDLSNMQKRERPNRWRLDIQVDNGAIESTVINLEKVEGKIDYPTRPFP